MKPNKSYLCVSGQINAIFVFFKYLSFKRTQQVINEFCSKHGQAHTTSVFFHWSKAKEMEMEEGSARVSRYESLLLVGPNHFFHRLLMRGRESSER